ncbi:hypothetical protein [Bartonella tribocorum]|uniref:Uncharacterized protein n=1 Tax=Bartonella tribocorum TaxID=85701 RepID=A0A2N9Y8H4_9HYPH|nr:hypothetical protein [Bartonella tribocorum]PIT68007.1 hypothetical protein CER18_08660 [Bartonella tribocorum]
MKAPTINVIIIIIIIALSPFFLVSEKAIAIPYHAQNGVTVSKMQSEKLQNYSGIRMKLKI